MSNAPVYYAFAQARFNPIEAMSKYMGEIQDKLRRDGYPLFEPHHEMRLELRSSEPHIDRDQRWLITRSDRTAGFILASTFIAYHTTHYDTRDAFLPELLRGLKAVHDVVTLDHVSRLGLRYLDAVLPQENERVEKYLVRGLHGVEFDAKPIYRLTESVFNTDVGPLIQAGTLIARVHKRMAPLGFPPDLVPIGLKIKPQFEVREVREHAVIDTDHFAEGRMPLDLAKLKEQLLTLHAIIKSVFRAMTTDHARAVWT